MAATRRIPRPRHFHILNILGLGSVFRSFQRFEESVGWSSWDPSLYLGDDHCIIHEVGTPMRTNLQKVTSQACMIIRWLIIIVIDQDISQYTPTTTYHNTLPTINYSSFVNGNFPMLSRRFSQIKLDFMAPYPGWNQIWTEPGSRPQHACGLWGAWWTTSFWSMGMGQNLSPMGPEILVLYMFSVNMYWPCIDHVIIRVPNFDI